MPRSSCSTPFEDLIERSAGEWEGLMRVEIEERYPNWLARAPPSARLRARRGDHRAGDRALRSIAERIRARSTCWSCRTAGVINVARTARGRGVAAAHQPRSPLVRVRVRCDRGRPASRSATGSTSSPPTPPLVESDEPLRLNLSRRGQAPDVFTRHVTRAAFERADLGGVVGAAELRRCRTTMSSSSSCCAVSFHGSAM